MGSKKQTVSLNVPAVVNIITDKGSPFVSATMTRREDASPAEYEYCDWNMQVYAAGVTCYVIGRGPRIDQQRVIDLCASVIRLNQAFPQVAALTLPRSEAATGHEMAPDDPGMQFENDPFWKRIKEIAGGGR
jgi:hypothetical protein